MDVVSCGFLLPLCILIIAQTSEAKSLASPLNQKFDDVDFAVESETIESVKEFSKKRGCTLIEKVTSKYYHIRCKEPKLRTDGLEQKMQESAKNDYGIKSLERQYYHMNYPRTNDPGWSKMWYLNGEILPNTKVTEVWKLGLNGSGITIAVVDVGIQVDHPDLINNVDILNEDLDVTAANKSHGTSVAGMIAAEANNNVCIVGMAYASRIIDVIAVGIRMHDVDEAKALSNKKEMVDIYSNSWGPLDDGTSYKSFGNVTMSAMKDGVTKGRNGKGAIYIFAAGNGGFNDNCNADGYASNLYTISITSIAFDRSAATYSEVCASAFAATYSGDKERSVISTDVNSLCVDGKAGTSFSAPQASAIVALALQANPSLTWRDVQHLIVHTSKRHDINDGFEEQSWQINGAGFNVSQIVGFGLIDAEAMVLQAKSWTHVNPQLCCSSVTMIVNKKVNNLWTGYGLPISNVSSVIKMGNECGMRSLEKVLIEVSLSYEFKRGDITLILESPSGTLSFLMTPRPNDINSSEEFTWNFTSVHFWGEKIAGTWKLLMKKDFHDTSKRQNVSATLTSWKLYFFGISKDANNNQKSSDHSFPEELIIFSCILSVFAVCFTFGIAYTIKRGKIKCKICRRIIYQTALSQEEDLPLRTRKSN